MIKATFANVSRIAFLLVFLAEPAMAQRATPSLRQFSSSLQELSTQVSPSVVQITGAGYGLQQDEHAGANVLSKQRSSGSGIIVSPDGYIMTNAHVIDGARTIHVKVNGVSSPHNALFDAKVVGKDRLLDVALLKIDAAGLQVLPFADSTELKQGELVLAFGSPLGMDNSATLGIVSAPARQLDDDDPRIFVQTDAPINPGNSGGPLVDIDGHLVGMNAFILSQSGGSEGIGFAIPSNVIRYAYTSLRKDGHVHRGQIGVFGRTITPPLAAVFHLEPESGVLVEDVLPGGAADDAGLRVGDVLLSIAGKPLRNVRDLSLELYEHLIGNTVQLQVLRNGETMAVNVPVTEDSSDPERFADLVSPKTNLVGSLAILALPIDDRVGQLLPSRRCEGGILVAALEGASRYFGDQPQQGDVLYEVNGKIVSTVESLRSAVDEIAPGDPLVLQIERDGRLMFLVLEAV